MKEFRIFEIESLRRGREGIYVRQGEAEISRNGEILDSGGFIRCSGSLVLNEETNEALLAHIDQWFLNERQKEVFDRLSPGTYRIFFIGGPISLNNSRAISGPEVEEFLESFKAGGKRQVSEIEDIFVDSHTSFWAVSYDPSARKLKIFTRKSNMIAEYDLNG